MGASSFLTQGVLLGVGMAIALALGLATVWAWCARKRWLAYGFAGMLGLAAVWFAAPSLAQSAGDLVEQVQRRTEAARPEAQALFDSVRGREVRYSEEAKALVEAAGSREILKRGFAHLEDTDFRGGGALANLGEEPETSDGVVYVAVSFSMPPGDLRRLAREAHDAGAVVVIQGLVRGSFQETLKAAKQVFDEDSLAGVLIDPNVFRAFNIKAAPTFVAAERAVQPCGQGLDCVPAAPAHDHIAGNITLAEALRLLERSGEQRTAAAAALARLGD